MYTQPHNGRSYSKAKTLMMPLHRSKDFAQDQTAFLIKNKFMGS